jgi:FdhD protein
MSVKKTNAIRYSEGISGDSKEELTWEEALQIKINGKPYTVTMRTPGNDTFLAAGLLLAEAVVSSYDDILSIKETATSVDVEIKKELLVNQNLFNRSIASSASCGVCGKTEICDLVIPREVNSNSKKLRTDLIPGLLGSMRNQQSTFERTGGSHAASLFTIDGDLLTVHEDIGRHNAVDKVIGELLISQTLTNAAILVISGRVSYEIVVKCAQAKIPFLVAVSAPSSLAVDFCTRYGITLIGFCRDRRFTVYSHSENMEHETWKMVKTQI